MRLADWPSSNAGLWAIGSDEGFKLFSLMKRHVGISGKHESGLHDRNCFLSVILIVAGSLCTGDATLMQREMVEAVFGDADSPPAYWSPSKYEIHTSAVFSYRSELPVLLICEVS